MQPSLSNLVSSAARECGFHLAGIAPAVPAEGQTFPELAYFEQWIDQGRAGEMEYLKRRDPAGKPLRSSVQVPFPWVRSVIVCAVNYNSAQPYSIADHAPDQGWIARYAWSGQPGSSGELAPTDYHDVIRDRLELLKSKLAAHLGEFQSRSFVDTGPLVERVYAKYAGLGWQAKNTCLINKSLGSWLFLGVLLTSLELPRHQWAAPSPDRCGSCTRCIDACPTGALEPYQMDARRCIAYLTIEKRGEIPTEFQEQTGRHVFGCDICQEVCPWNDRGGRGVPVTDWPELQARPELVNPALDWLAGLDEPEYRRLFRGSPLERAKFAGFERNIANAQKNSGRE